MYGLHGCILCDQPPPHSHDFGVILNTLYYCADGQRHHWGTPSRWFRVVRCGRCGAKKPKARRRKR